MKHAYRNHSINHSKSGSVPSFAQFAKSAKTASAPSLEMLEELVPCWLGIQIKNNTVVIDLMWVCIYIYAWIIYVNVYVYCIVLELCYYNYIYIYSSLIILHLNSILLLTSSDS